MPSELITVACAIITVCQYLLQRQYARFTWETQDGTLGDLVKVRMCRSCCHRYMEMMDGVAAFDSEAIEMMQRDAQRVMEKLGLQGV